MGSVEELVCSILTELVQKAETSTRMLIERNVAVEGGLVSSAKTYVKSAVVVIKKAKESGIDVARLPCTEDLLEILERAKENVIRYESQAQEHIRRRLLHLRRHLIWLINEVKG